MKAGRASQLMQMSYFKLNHIDQILVKLQLRRNVNQLILLALACSTCKRKFSFGPGHTMGPKSSQINLAGVECQA